MSPSQHGFQASAHVASTVTSTNVAPMGRNGLVGRPSSPLKIGLEAMQRWVLPQESCRTLEAKQQMPCHIFLSYAREDETRIEPLVRALEDQGWSVFWDRRIPSGQTWRSYIGKALTDARCVIVAWSRFSITSGWVSEEADEGKARNILVPVLLDAVEPPIGFRSVQAADLTNWQSEHPSPRFEHLLNDIGTLLNSTPTLPRSHGAADSKPGIFRRQSESKALSQWFVYIVALLLVLTGGANFWINRAKTAVSSPPIPIPSSPNQTTAGAAEGAAPSVKELEQRLKAANIVLSTGTSEDLDRVRNYFTGPKSAYHLLAVSCLQVLENDRLRKPGYLDMVDKWYTWLVGEKNYVSADGTLNLEKLKEAMVKAQNEYHGDGVTSFEQLIEPRVRH